MAQTQYYCSWIEFSILKKLSGLQTPLVVSIESFVSVFTVYKIYLDRLLYFYSWLQLS